MQGFKHNTVLETCFAKRKVPFSSVKVTIPLKQLNSAHNVYSKIFLKYPKLMYLMLNETFENHIHFITGLQSSLQLALQAG